MPLATRVSTMTWPVLPIAGKILTRRRRRATRAQKAAMPLAYSSDQSRPIKRPSATARFTSMRNMRTSSRIASVVGRCSE